MVTFAAHLSGRVYRNATPPVRLSSAPSFLAGNPSCS
jgi:hypothetical protein